MTQSSDEPGASEKIEQEIAAAENFFATIVSHARSLAERLQDQFSSETIFYQIGAIAFAALIGWLGGRPFRAWISARTSAPPEGEDIAIRFNLALRAIIAPAIIAGILWAATPAFAAAGLPFSLMRIVANLISAWVAIRLASSLVRDPFWSRFIAGAAWFAAALNILRLLGPAIDTLDKMRLPIAGRASLYDILSAAILAVILLWAARIAARFIQARLQKSEKLTPSVRGLLGQLIQIVLIAGALMAALSAAQVDLTGLAVLTGAIGVGIGFGLQSIFSNFIAGIIILLEKTLKVGDFVDLESGITGEVKEINVRSTLVTTNDNVDILVPNAEFITNRVTNWTLREVYRRIRVPFGVAYGTDKELVKKAALEAAEKTPYTLKNNPKRAPQVWLVGFGDSSLDFELVVWLSDEAVRRPGAVNAAYNWELETALGKYGIEIPFPQRDLHLIPPKDKASGPCPEQA